jgi:hypothetical protein
LHACNYNDDPGWHPVSYLSEMRSTRRPAQSIEQDGLHERPAPALSATDAVLALQRSAGNAQVAALLQRQQAQAPALPSAEVLTERIAQAIGVWETNRGGDAPNPRESELVNVVGVPGNMATIEQATMPYALDAFSRSAALRNRANPPLTRAEIAAALERVHGVERLLGAVDAAARAGTAPDDFIQAERTLIDATGLADDHVRTMFDAVGLRARVREGHARVRAGQSTPEQEAGAIPAEERMGIGVGSLTSYVRTPRNWGENRAAWQRLAVQLMPNDVARRIEEVSEAGGGTSLVMLVVRRRVDAALRRTPPPTEEDVVRTVGAQNNPREEGYGDNIWRTYQRLFD